MPRVRGERQVPRTTAEAESRLRAIEREIARIVAFFPELKNAARPREDGPGRHGRTAPREARVNRVLH